MFLNSSPVSRTSLGAMGNNDFCVFFPLCTQVMLDPQFKHLSLTLALRSFSLFLAELFQVSQSQPPEPAYTGSQESSVTSRARPLQEAMPTGRIGKTTCDYFNCWH